MVCGETYTCLKRLTEHTNSCGKIFKCDHCGQGYTCEKSLKGHINAKHIRQFRCEKCDMAFENPSKLERHLLTHKERKAFNCDICGKPFSRKDNMNQHKKKKHSNNNSK